VSNLACVEAAEWTELQTNVDTTQQCVGKETERCPLTTDDTYQSNKDEEFRNSPNYSFESAVDVFKQVTKIGKLQARSVTSFVSRPASVRTCTMRPRSVGRADASLSGVAKERGPLIPAMRSQVDRFPVSVKGVVIHGGCILLLLNERGEWDLPGGRPESGEDHRAALVREVAEETGLSVEVSGMLGEHLFEVLPQRVVRIVAFGCRVSGSSDVALSDEHLDVRWLPLSEIGEHVAGHKLPVGYLAAIRTFAAANAP
jgi:8-oxo-dGTP pyrophosphatase MutT (NUDIX family)